MTTLTKTINPQCAFALCYVASGALKARCGKPRELTSGYATKPESFRKAPRHG